MCLCALNGCVQHKCSFIAFCVTYIQYITSVHCDLAIRLLLSYSTLELDFVKKFGLTCVIFVPFHQLLPLGGHHVRLHQHIPLTTGGEEFDRARDILMY